MEKKSNKKMSAKKSLAIMRDKCHEKNIQKLGKNYDQKIISNHLSMHDKHFFRIYNLDSLNELHLFSTDVLHLQRSYI